LKMRDSFYPSSGMNYTSGCSSGLFLVAAFFILISTDGLGQKVCNNPPALTMGSVSGTTCYLMPVTVSDNSFGGSATQVTITTDGKGSVNPSTATSSPFLFTYIPDASDVGHTVTVTVTTDNPLRSPCKAAKATYSLSVLANLSAPVIDGIIQPTCTLSTGSIQLSGLPSSGWTVTVNPLGLILEGTGNTTTISILPAGTYTFTVAVSSGCASSESVPAVINDQPGSPPPPLPGSITAPTCTTATGSVTLGNLPSPGSWILTQYPGTIQTTGTGTSAVVSGLPPGLYNFSVTNSAGCVSELSGNVIIPGQPSLPATPVIGNIVQPTAQVPTGSVTLTGLPPSGSWTIIRSPDNFLKTGSGTSVIISELGIGTFTFAVRNNAGCLSNESDPVVIIQSVKPELVITDPLPVCYPETVDITAPEITAGSTQGLLLTYWTDASATKEFRTPGAAWNGLYYIKGTSASGDYDIKPVTVTVKQPPVANAGPDKSIAYQTSTTLSAYLGTGETGTWTSDSGNVVFSNITDPNAIVSDLSTGNNRLYWIVTNNVCPADTDEVTIVAGGLVIPTLITPNGDSKNEYFIIEGIESIGKCSLTIFDRRGKLVFESNNYDNKWNGIDYNSNPVANDTYFYILKSSNGRSFNGYIMVMR
jgi:gliding motility-associated-like protein